jgi:hypothetical protein
LTPHFSFTLSSCIPLPILTIPGKKKSFIYTSRKCGDTMLDFSRPHNVRADAFRAAQDGVNEISDKHDEIINQTRALFMFLSRLAPIRQLDREASKRILADLQSENSKLYSVISIVLPRRFWRMDPMETSMTGKKPMSSIFLTRERTCSD